MTRTMLLPWFDPDDRHNDDYELLWGWLAVLPPSLLLCGIVILVLAVLG